MREEFHRALGIELSGVKSDRSAVTCLDYYAKAGRLVVSEIQQNFASDMEFSSDQKLLQHINLKASEPQISLDIAIHGPLDFPPYLKVHNLGQKLTTPESSTDPEVLWMNQLRKQLEPSPKAFVPYLQRPAEIWLRHMTPERFQINDGFGSNAAPVAARLQYLIPHLPNGLMETAPRISLIRIGDSLKVPKKILRLYSDLEEGIACREEILTRLLNALPKLFIYEKDMEQIILNVSCFHSFIGALTAFLNSKGHCVTKPQNFPPTAQWIAIPKRIIPWPQI